MKKIIYYITDVFTDRQFGGNQLAVIPDGSGLDTEMMQKIAREFNFSETTFITPPKNPQNDCNVRIFTPGNEVPTAGHATIGTTFVLLSEGLLSPKNPGKIILEQKVGDITVVFKKEGNSYHSITMYQPLPKFGPVDENRKLIAEILSVGTDEIMKEYPIQSISCGNNFLFIPVNSIKTLEKIKIRTDLLEKHEKDLDTTEFYIFSMETAGKNATTHGRMFAPLFGITEDPATGSASGPLGCYLVRYGLSDGKDVICEQGYEMGRPSTVHVTIEHEQNRITEVKVGGKTTLVGRGELLIKEL
jgi:trans-2,3-dihydro-3-hydroxyanthranilate isomerase